MDGDLVLLRVFLKRQQEREQEYLTAQTKAANDLADKQLKINEAAARAANSSARASWVAMVVAALLTVLTAVQVVLYIADRDRPTTVVVKEPVTVQQPNP
jgi:hypothetical protein